LILASALVSGALLLVAANTTPRSLFDGRGIDVPVSATGVDPASIIDMREYGPRLTVKRDNSVWVRGKEYPSPERDAAFLKEWLAVVAEKIGPSGALLLQVDAAAEFRLVQVIASLCELEGIRIRTLHLLTRVEETSEGWLRVLAGVRQVTPGARIIPIQQAPITGQSIPVLSVERSAADLEYTLDGVRVVTLDGITEAIEQLRPPGLRIDAGEGVTYAETLAAIDAVRKAGEFTVSIEPRR